MKIQAKIQRLYLFVSFICTFLFSPEFSSDKNMRSLFLIMAWITPAVIAGILNWKGIWGSGSALFDYLIPIPVAGGALHVPSFALAATVIAIFHKLPASLTRWLPLIALSIALCAQTLQLNFGQINDWLFTDFEPASSGIRFGKNPLLLFIFCDALFVFLFAFLRGCRISLKQGLAVLLVPFAIIISQAILYQNATGTRFVYGYSQPGKTRGQEIVMVYTDSTYDEVTFRGWLDNDHASVKPWNSPNAEHTAVFFTNSMQAIRWHKMSTNENIVATVCLYEEDRSVTMHAGYTDCFAHRKTVSARMDELFKSAKTGLGRDIDKLWAYKQLCRDVRIPTSYDGDIELFRFCRAMGRGDEKQLKTLVQKYGTDSAQVEFLKKNIMVHEK